MKEFIKELVAKAPNPLLARRTAAEYLQARILQALQERGVFDAWMFHGGTALRFLYSLPRFSEDLDFSLAGRTGALAFADVIRGVAAAFEAETYVVDVKINDEKTVKSAFLRFRGLPREMGLSARAEETLSVKVEIDFNPPAGATTQTTIIRRHVLLNLYHHDQATLLAGKLHAVFSRPYGKGRDVYDLFWYLSDRSWPPPNLTFLNNALIQTRWDGPVVTEKNWRRLLSRRLKEMDWSKVIDDVRPFIERDQDIKLLTRENLLKLMKG